jgi:ribosome-binding factor A
VRRRDGGAGQASPERWHLAFGGSSAYIGGMKQTATPETRSVRTLRVGEQVRHALSEILMRGDVHDETLARHMVSVTEVRMSPDLRHATVFVKPLLGKEEEVVLKALRTNTAYLQSEVAKRVNTKYAAKLKFLADESFDEGSHIDSVLRSPKVARDLEGRESKEN